MRVRVSDTGRVLGAAAVLPRTEAAFPKKRRAASSSGSSWGPSVQLLLFLKFQEEGMEEVGASGGAEARRVPGVSW